MESCKKCQKKEPIRVVKSCNEVKHFVICLIIIIIIIIIIFINCSWVDTQWQWLFYMHTEYDSDYY
jgi:uncharacterized integral membrane protein